MRRRRIRLGRGGRRLGWGSRDLMWYDMMNVFDGGAKI